VLRELVDSSAGARRTLTSQMNVNRSCHLAFLGNRTFDPMYAATPIAATAASEAADVTVKISGEDLSSIFFQVKGMIVEVK
jgi:hypothetical protein